MHYCAKRRLDLKEIFSRVRGGSSMRDIARELGCSPTAVANAVLRLGRQSMAMHIDLLCALKPSVRLSFDGLLSAVTSHDYPSQITTLGDSESEMVLAITHCVTERGGTRTPAQRARIQAKRLVWRPHRGALSRSISQLINELPRFASLRGFHIDTDEHPVYRRLLENDLALQWFLATNRLSVHRTPASAARTTANPLFLMNYIDRMIRHRMREHSRESIGVARNATMQMHRLWIFAWDHNTRQPFRVAQPCSPCRAARAGVTHRRLSAMGSEFFSRRHHIRGLPIPDSIRAVWSATVPTPPVRWRTGQIRFGPAIPAYALLDLRFACPHVP